MIALIALPTDPPQGALAIMDEGTKAGPRPMDMRSRILAAQTCAFHRNRSRAPVVPIAMMPPSPFARPWDQRFHSDLLYSCPMPKQQASWKNSRVPCASWFCFVCDKVTTPARLLRVTMCCPLQLCFRCAAKTRRCPRGGCERRLQITAAL